MHDYSLYEYILKSLTSAFMIMLTRLIYYVSAGGGYLNEKSADILQDAQRAGGYYPAISK